MPGSNELLAHVLPNCSPRLLWLVWSPHLIRRTRERRESNMVTMWWRPLGSLGRAILTRCSMVVYTFRSPRHLVISAVCYACRWLALPSLSNTVIGPFDFVFITPTAFYTKHCEHSPVLLYILMSMPHRKPIRLESESRSVSWFIKMCQKGWTFGEESDIPSFFKCFICFSL